MKLLPQKEIITAQDLQNIKDGKTTVALQKLGQVQEALIATIKSRLNQLKKSHYFVEDILHDYLLYFLRVVQEDKHGTYTGKIRADKGLSLSYFRDALHGKSTRKGEVDRWIEKDSKNRDMDEILGLEQKAESREYDGLYAQVKAIFKDKIRCWKCIEMFYFHARSHKDIAEEMGISESAAKQKHYRCIQNLRDRGIRLD